MAKAGEGLQSVKNKKDEIISAAAEAFMEKGFSATSLDDIADRLRCTKGLIYYNFKNKIDLFFAVHRHSMNLNLNNIKSVINRHDSPIDKINNIISTHMDLTISHLPFQRVAVMGLEFHLLGSTTPQERKTLADLVEMHREYERIFVQLIKEGIDAGYFANKDPALLAKLVLGTLNWMVMWFRVGSKSMNKGHDVIFEHISDFVISGLRTAGD